jgi:hypothetical protein
MPEESTQDDPHYDYVPAARAKRWAAEEFWH